MGGGGDNMLEAAAVGGLTASASASLHSAKHMCWRVLPSGREVLCLEHSDEVPDLWSNAKNICDSVPRLCNLQYRDKQDQHPEDTELKDNFADECFHRTEFGKIIIVGIAP